MVEKDADPDREDLGFRFRARKNGEVEITQHGKPAAVLRGPAATKFLAASEGIDARGVQLLMARVTGNYKRGNERQASQHPRRRG